MAKKKTMFMEGSNLSIASFSLAEQNRDNPNEIHVKDLVLIPKLKSNPIEKIICKEAVVITKDK